MSHGAKSEERPVTPRYPAALLAAPERDLDAEAQGGRGCLEGAATGEGSAIMATRKSPRSPTRSCSCRCRAWRVRRGCKVRPMVGVFPFHGRRSSHRFGEADAFARSAIEASGTVRMGTVRTAATMKPMRRNSAAAISFAPDRRYSGWSSRHVTDFTSWPSTGEFRVRCRSRSSAIASPNGLRRASRNKLCASMSRFWPVRRGDWLRLGGRRQSARAIRRAAERDNRAIPGDVISQSGGILSVCLNCLPLRSRCPIPHRAEGTGWFPAPNGSIGEKAAPWFKSLLVQPGRANADRRCRSANG
jgi:hypothetical protein